MRPNDLFSLVIFENKAYTIIPLDYVSNFNKEEIYARVDTLKTLGGTTIITGFEEGLKNMNLITPPFKTEKRIVLLTDVEDNSLETT